MEFTVSRLAMDGDWKSPVSCPFTIWTSDPSTVVRVTAFETWTGLVDVGLADRCNRLALAELKPS
jgi:hypothetical protein